MENNRTKDTKLTVISLIGQIGGVVMLAGAAMPIAGLEASGAIALLVGSVLYGVVQILDGYKGTDFRVRRLRRQQVLGAGLLMAAGVLAVLHTYQIAHIGSGEWKLAMSIGVVMQLYTAFRLPIALRDAGEE